MGLETGTYIDSLNASNPQGSDGKSAGDDHIRLLKSTIKATFPNVTGAITPTQTELNYVAGVTSLIQTQLSTLDSGKQSTNVNLTAESGLTGAADKLSYYTGLGAKALTTMTAAARSLLDDADAETMRTTLGAQAALVSGANIKTVNGGSLLGSGDILVGETIGAVAAFAMNSVPSGWLAANGAAVSRTTYAALFAAIGTTYGAGDGSTTFALPDLRGYFVRGSGTNSDGTASGTFGAKQADELKAHAHNLSIALKPQSETSTTDPSHSNGFGEGASATATSTGGTETRPKNIAMLYCIKY